MNSSGHLTVSNSVTRRVKKAKGQKRGRPRGRNGKNGDKTPDPATTMAAAGTLTRTKALLLAALRVWELKHRIHDQ
ncbi:MAG TPA: hypothetical protein VIU85_01750 [Chthoniobacterales bacterium]